MDINVQQFASLLGALTIAVLIGGVILAMFVKSYFPSYLSEKGKNLATGEDIAKITDEIERVKTAYATQLQGISHQNSLLLEELRGRSQLRLAAVEQRLRAHQEAYRIWKGILMDIHNPGIRETVNAGYEWWNNNCLYLGGDARYAFEELLWAASHHDQLLLKGVDPKEASANFAIIRGAGKAIVESAELPPLGEREWRIGTAT